ncbi:MFS transporter [Saccharopolyspora terrae]|uniref:MFS transporter n=1 Tax=Saccharopolyspora terrae TaxID=2530384 RepID=A0A4R4VVU7_9PSEU|nr:MFS transporter [Saccharopolyspora terrae]TDD10188.1 MFS transporter [Saccharopolyspora terrae]
MTSTSTADRSQLRAVRKVALGSSIGTTVEAYDFQIYGVASALVFGSVFFAGVPASLGTVFSFATLAVGFLARPVGAIVFGHFGDRVGRKKLLVIALMGAGGCTTLIGMLPPQASVGIWAPTLLVVLRLMQGLFHGGEQGGALLMAVEHAPAHRRGWYGSWAFLGSPGGSLLAAGTLSITIAATGDSFLAWGWRIPFLASFVLLGIGMVIRATVSESPEFAKLKGEGQRAKSPLAEVLRNSWRLVLAAIGVNLGFNAFIWVLLSYSLAYGTQYLGVERQVMLTSTLVGSGAMVLAILAFARLSDAIGRMPIMIGGALFCTAYPFPLFALLETRSTTVITTAIVVGFVGASALFGPMAAFLAELFPTKVAYSGVSLGYSLGAVLGGGLAPFIASVLMHASGGAYWSVSLYLTIGALVTLFSLLYLRRRGPAQAEALVEDVPAHETTKVRAAAPDERGAR